MTEAWLCVVCFALVFVACSRVVEPIQVGQGRVVTVVPGEGILFPLDSSELHEYERVFNSFETVNNPVYRTIQGRSYRLHVSVLLVPQRDQWARIFASDTQLADVRIKTSSYGTSILYRRGSTLATIARPAGIQSPSIALCYTSRDTTSVLEWFASERYHERLSKP